MVLSDMMTRGIADRMDGMNPSATILLTAQAKELKRQGKDVLIFAAGEPNFNTPENVKMAAIAAIQSNVTRYTQSEGILELRKAICEKFKRENNINYAPDEVLVSCGAKHSLINAILAIINPGDEVIIPVPYWVSYLSQVHLAGGISVLIESGDDFKTKATDIAKKITKKTKLIILNTPNNPSGMIIDKKELKAIADLAVMHGIFVISDEVYEHFIYDNKQHTSIASLGEEVKNITLTINAVSKSYAMTGWRIGYAAGSKHIISAMGVLQSQMTSNPSSIAQMAALEALQGQQDSIVQMREAFVQRKEYVVNALNAIQGIHCEDPEGAFYAFFDMRALYGAKTKDGRVINDDVLFTTAS